MLQYVIAGLALGGLYAIAASSLTATYRSAGILNFSFGALAYFFARFFYFLNTQHGWGILPAFLVSVVIAGPLAGVGLYYYLFRYLTLSPPLIKVVATLGLSVAIPPIAQLCFGNVVILNVPGLAPQPVRIFHFAGVPVSLDQVIVYGCVVAILGIGSFVLLRTDIGLRVRATVDSPAMTSLAGTSPQAVAIGVWASGTFLTALVGVLSAPTIGLDANDFTLLMAAAFAAVVAARLKDLKTAVVVALAMGVADALLQRYLSPTSSFTAAVIPSIPFVIMAIFLVYNIIRHGAVDENAGVGGAIDRAVTPLGQGGDHLEAAGRLSGSSPGSPVRGVILKMPLLVVIAAVMPFLFSSFWQDYLAQGAALAVVFLSFTLVTGEGGMIWLCQITFAGIGALTAAQLSTNYGWPVLPAVLAGGILAAPIGALIGFLTIRLGALYVALVTLTFGFLMEQLVFTREIFWNFGIGVSISPPAFLQSPRALTLFCLLVFCVLSLFVANLRRSTTGLALNAVRWSSAGAQTIGIGILPIKILVSAAAAFVAGLGGGLFALANGSANPTDFLTLTGVIWFSTLVTAGVRSNAAAYVAGISFTLFPALMQVYLPSALSPIPTILFGTGAIYIAKVPEGWVPQTNDQVRRLWSRVRTVRAGRITELDLRSAEEHADAVGSGGRVPRAGASGTETT